MNDIIQDIETAELHTYNTIKIISSLQDTITKLTQDEATSDSEMFQFEEEAEYLRKLAQKVADDLTPPAPNCSSVTFDRKFHKTKSKTKIKSNSTPKFIQARPKGSKEVAEKSQQTDRKALKVLEFKHKKTKSKKHGEAVAIKPKIFTSLVLRNEPPLQPTKYLEHILIPIKQTDNQNMSAHTILDTLQNNAIAMFPLNKNNRGLAFNQNQMIRRKSGVEHFAKLMQLCMNVKEERESDLEKQIYNLEEEMQAVMESNKNLYHALEKLEEQNSGHKVLKDNSTNTLNVILSNKSAPLPNISFDIPPNRTHEQLTNELAEDIIKCIHADIKEITSNIAKTKSQSKLIFGECESNVKSKFEYGKHVTFLEKAISSMQNKLETAQNKQVELAIQSKAVVEAAHRMGNNPLTN